MKFTLSWLKEHLETDATLDEICARLTAIGLEVEAMDDKAPYRPFVFVAYAGLDDPLIEINLTPNRPDCAGVHGIARDLAASGLGQLKTRPVPDFQVEGQTPLAVRLELDDAALCPGFGLRIVRGVKNGASPQWLKNRLIAIGLRPINALVDITNYMSFDQGRPLHVFDATKVAGDLIVRRAREGETLIALDQRQYTLGPTNIVIADDTGVTSIGGIMGGKHSGCDEGTVDVLIESALWDPINIARTGRSLGIVSDARYRFERGVDPDDMRPGLERATELVLQLCGGIAAEANIVGGKDYQPKIIDFPFSEVRRLTGLTVAPQECVTILQSLGFGVAGASERVSVSTPSWRPDVEGKADLVEEIARIHGVDNIAPEPLGSLGAMNGRILTVLQTRTRMARRALACRGMLEAVTWSFIPEQQAKLFGGGSAALKLANPITADMSDMRPSLLPGLLSAARCNADKGHGDGAIFEVSSIYEGDAPENQRCVAGGLRCGTSSLAGAGRMWSNTIKGAGKPVDVYDAKADALAVIEACGLPMTNVQIEAGGPDWYHPGRCGTIKIGPKTVLGYFGEFHLRALAALDVSGPCCGFEIYLDAMPEPKKKVTRTKPALELFPFQAVKRDFAFVVDGHVEASAIVKAAAGADRKLVAGVTVFDVFEGAALGEDKKSVAIEVHIQPIDKTLTEEDFEALTAKIVSSVKKSTGGVLRG